jgi:hypothetical protein
MAIGTDAAIDFFGTQDTVTVGTGTSAVSDGAFSASGDVVSGGWTNDDDAPIAEAVLTWQYASGTITGGIHLYARRMNVNGTADEPQPSLTCRRPYVGTFVLNTAQATTTDTTYAITIPLDNLYTSQVYEFYTENTSGVTMTAGWTVKITPKTLGPKPA